MGTGGGALLAVDREHYTILQSEVSMNSVSAKIQSTMGIGDWWLTVVYGPQEDSGKLQFLQELRAIRNNIPERWLVVGDFNTILQAQDKSNANLNRRMMGEFRKAVDDMQLKELKLMGRRFTWSNDRTQTRIDSAFCTADWDLMLPDCNLQALSSLVSDHCPLLMVGNTSSKGSEASDSRFFGRGCLGIMKLFSKRGGPTLPLSTLSCGCTSSCSAPARGSDSGPGRELGTSGCFSLQHSN